MDLSRLEKMVLDEKYPIKCKWLFLFPSLFFFALFIFVLAFGYLYFMPQTENVWNGYVSQIQKLHPGTDLEKSIYDSAVFSVKLGRKSSVLYVQRTTGYLSMMFYVIGLWLFGTYIREKQYRELIKKIQGS